MESAERAPGAPVLGILRVGGAVLTLVAILAVGGCFSEDPVSVLPDECRELARAAGVADGEVVVGIRSFSFVPSEITVEAGTQVTWVNCEPPGTERHTTTARDEAVETWDSGLLDRGDVFQHTFEAPGENPYFCIPHEPIMQGTVTVE